MKNKNVWFAYAAAWISTATAVIFAIKYTGSAWCLVALALPAMQKISISNAEENENNLELEDMKMKNYELIVLLMELPAGYDIKFGKTVT